jgi:hypothetical protein
VAIQIEGDAYIGRAQKFLDYLRMDTLGEQQGGESVPEVMETRGYDPHAMTFWQ